MIESRISKFFVFYDLGSVSLCLLLKSAVELRVSTCGEMQEVRKLRAGRLRQPEHQVKKANVQREPKVRHMRFIINSIQKRIAALRMVQHVEAKPHGSQSLQSRLISNVIFDLDGTLLNTERIMEDVLKDFLAKYEKQWDGRGQEKRLGKKPLEAAEIIVEDYQLPCTAEEFLAEILPWFEDRQGRHRSASTVCHLEKNPGQTLTETYHHRTSSQHKSLCEVARRGLLYSPFLSP
eukprot:Gb_14638 [translate_table: standard]